MGAILLTASALFLLMSFGLPMTLQRAVGPMELIIKIILCGLIIGLFIWCWTSTWYKIGNEKLVAKCGPFKYLVPINSIKTIRTGQKTIGGVIKPTLSWNCIEIEYGKYNRLRISPENEEQFLKTLSSLNKEIIIKLNA